MSEPSNIQSSNEPTVDLTGGVVNGTVELDRTDLPEHLKAGVAHREKIVHEFDDKGEIVGWHKETVVGTEQSNV